MAEETPTIRGINWREAFPFTHLFRTFRIAVHPSKLALALALLLCLYVGGRILDGIWPLSHWPTAEELMRHGMIDSGLPGDHEALLRSLRDGFADSRAPEIWNEEGPFMTFFKHQVHQVDTIARSVLQLNAPGVNAGIYAFFARGPLWLAKAHPVFAILFTIWFLLVWSIFGGAVARIAAVHVARDEKLSVKQALKFSISKVLSFGFAPLIPLIIILAIGVLVAVGGLLLYIPVVGPILVGLLFFLALIGGFVMTLVLLGTFGGFNLMYPTVAVEGSDSFDAISRSFSYVYARPWRMLLYTLIALLYGAITYLFIRVVLFLVLSLTHFFVGWFLSGQSDAYWQGTYGAAIWSGPASPFNLSPHINFAGLKWSEDLAAWFTALWVFLTIGLLGAYAISFYFSANTIIYYLMRQEVDATELDDVYLEQSDEEFAESAAPATTPAAPAATAPVSEPAPPAPASPAAPVSSEPPPSGTAPTIAAPAESASPVAQNPPPTDNPPATQA